MKPIWAGCFTPVLHLTAKESLPFAKLAGPCCYFGTYRTFVHNFENENINKNNKEY